MNYLMYFSGLLLNSSVWNLDFIRLCFSFFFFNLKFTTDFATDYICDRKYLVGGNSNWTFATVNSVANQKVYQEICDRFFGLAKSVAKFCDRFFWTTEKSVAKFGHKWPLRPISGFLQPKNQSQRVNFIVVKC